MTINDFGHNSFVTHRTGLIERIKKAEDIQMRKYRGLTKEGKWVYGCHCKIESKHYIVLDRGMPYSPCGEDSCFYKSIFDRFIEVIPETVGQFTGLHDKNGKEIYEGDILLNDKDSECMPGQSFIVKYIPGHFVAGGILGAGDHIGQDCKIIGNIHQNPELMEQKNG